LTVVLHCEICLLTIIIKFNNNKLNIGEYEKC